MRFQKHIKIEGIVVCKTGLHIGGSGGQIEIGSIVDLSLIKHPLFDEPYIPGSSLKGKLRSLLESKQTNYQWKKRRVDGKEEIYKDVTETEPCGCAECMICRVFGPHKNTGHKLGPSRLLVRDACLTPKWEEKFRQLRAEGNPFYEEKTENIINRMTSVAEHPRTQERVPAGAEFEFRIVLRVFEGDDEERMTQLIGEGLKMLQDDYLGGSGSRGYGEVELRNLKRDGQSWTL
jgi:CRISPR-associated protein Csm3